MEIVYLSALTHGNAATTVMIVLRHTCAGLGSDLRVGDVGDVIGGGETEAVGFAFDAGVGEGAGAITVQGRPGSAVDG